MDSDAIPLMPPLSQWRLLIFAKAPIPGQVKTRLIPSLGAWRACLIYKRLLQRTLQMVTQQPITRQSTASHDRRLSLPYAVELWCAPTPHHPFLHACRRSYGVSLHRQQGRDLGQRMQHAFQAAFTRSQCVVLIGSDCPSLSLEDVTHACNALTHGYEVVLSPAEDGGYVLIGLRRPQARLFQNIPWGTAHVWTKTQQRIRQEGLSSRVLAMQWDVDRMRDWHRYCRSRYKLVRAPSEGSSVSSLNDSVV